MMEVILSTIFSEPAYKFSVNNNSSRSSGSSRSKHVFGASYLLGLLRATHNYSLNAHNNPKR